MCSESVCVCECMYIHVHMCECECVCVFVCMSIKRQCLITKGGMLKMSACRLQLNVIVRIIMYIHVCILCVYYVVTILSY